VNEKTDRELLKELIERCVKTGGPFTLASGRESNFYFDGKQVTLNATGLQLLGQILAPLIIETGANALGGPSTGADPMVAAIGLEALSLGKPLDLFFVRKEAKGHGTGKRIEGPPIPPRSSAVLIEDVVTSGGSLIRAILAFREETEAQVDQAFCIVDREEGGISALAEIGVTLHPLFVAHDFF
jgi:orotate phosphoribosyltransferase